MEGKFSSEGGNREGFRFIFKVAWCRVASLHLPILRRPGDTETEPFEIDLAIDQIRLRDSWE